MKRLFPLFLIVFLFSVLFTGCPTELEEPQPEEPADVVTFFWGEWTRMDNGKSFIVEEDSVKYNSKSYEITSTTENTLSVKTLGDFVKESDSVMVCDSIPYFRKGGTNLEYKLKVVGFNNSRAASTSGLSGIKGKGKSNVYKSFRSEAESDANGEITFTAPTLNDIQTVTIENNGNDVVVSNLKIQNSGDFMGTVALVEPGQFNLKISGTIDESKKHSGYLYGNNAKEYEMKIVVENVSDVDIRYITLAVDADDPNLTVTSSADLTGYSIPTMHKGATTKDTPLKVSVKYGKLDDIYVDTGLKVTMSTAESDLVWEDYIPLRFYKGTMPVSIATSTSLPNSTAALNGFIIYPDGNSQFFNISNNKAKTLYVPIFESDKAYRLVFSGATTSLSLSKSTEMFYTVVAGSKTAVPVVTSGSGLNEYYLFGGNNHSEVTAYEVNDSFEAYLSEGEIDYYTIKANIGNTYYLPTGTGYHTVSYTSEFGTVPENKTVTNGTKLTADNLPVLEAEGMTFDGWYDGETKVEAGSYTVNDSVTLTAKWIFNITYNLDGGSNSESNPSTYVIEDTITFENPTRTGYVFDGWYDNADFEGTTITGYEEGTSGAKTLYAKWTPVSYTITYMLDDKGTNAASNPETYTVEDEITLAPATSETYGFGGWFKTEDCTGIQTAVITNGIYYGNLTLYAKWAEKRNVTYVSAHGTQPDAIVVAAGTVLSTVQLADLSDEEYLFMGWYSDEGYTAQAVADTYTVSGGDVTLYAKWVKKCTITYVTAYGTAESVEVAENTELTAEHLPSLKEDGYVLRGWYTETEHENKITSGYTITDDMTLYALWEEFVFVEGGTFEMGSSTTHSVTLSDFFMSPYEVTQKMYKEVMGTNPSYFPSYPASGEVQEERPVEKVSWYDAVYFCNKYSEANGFTPCYSVNGSTDVTAWGYTPHNGNSISGTITCDFTADGYRLPTEAEWEYAAKGGKNKDSYLYSGSDTPGDVAWYEDNSGRKTHQVGLKAANSLGLYDMSGNVWEWCWDRYGSYISETQSNPTGAGTGFSRVWRGGGWSSDATNVRCANRGSINPSGSNNSLGFRVVRSCSN